MHGLPAIGELKLYGMKAAFDGIITTAELPPPKDIDDFVFDDAT